MLHKHTDLYKIFVPVQTHIHKKMLTILGLSPNILYIYIQVLSCLLHNCKKKKNILIQNYNEKLTN